MKKESILFFKYQMNIKTLYGCENRGRFHNKWPKKSTECTEKLKIHAFDYNISGKNIK